MSNTVTPSRTVSEDQINQFQQEGYFVLESVVPPEHLEILRAEAQGAIDRTNAEMDRLGTDQVNTSVRGKRYFSHHCYEEKPELGEFIFSPLMADICRATLGETAYLFWNQYVIKCADKQSAFSWHQDSGYVGHPNHKPYLTCWITLDDVNEENGTVYLLPYSHLGIRTYVQHEVSERTHDLVGYFGTDRGIPVIAPAGSIAAFSSHVFHSSGANLTQRMRRVFLAQYASEIIMSKDGTKPWAGNSEPFLQDNKIVWTAPAAVK